MKPTFSIVLLSMACLVCFASPGTTADTPAMPDGGDDQEQNQRLERRIDEIDRQLDRLEKTLQSARKEAQVELKKKLPELREKEQQLKKDAVRLRESGRKVWQELEATLGEMQRAIDRAQKEEP